jgi:transcriptional regulator of arginine metabolism
MPTDREIQMERRLAILEILKEQQVRSQREMAQLLQARGIAATQSSVSRDLWELGVDRVDGYYQLVHQPKISEKQRRQIGGFIKTVKLAGPYLTVLTTFPGAAKMVAYALEDAEWPEVAGTMAEYDRIFLATADGRSQRRLLRRLKEVTGEDLRDELYKIYG